jgi:TRAP-type mannitol/chloroaromatic compound transport system permease large subunit
VSLGDIYRSIVPFVLVMMLGLIIVMLFPGIALWLPEYYFGR